MLVETRKNVNSPASISAVKISISSVSSPVIKEQKIHVVNVTSLERIWSLKWLNAKNFKYCPLLFRDRLLKHVIWSLSYCSATEQTQMNPVEIPAGEGCLLVQLSNKTHVLQTKHSDQEREFPLLLSHPSSLHEEENSPDPGVWMGVKKAALHCTSHGATLRVHEPRDTFMVFP